MNASPIVFNLRHALWALVFKLLFTDHFPTDLFKYAFAFKLPK